MYRYIATSVAGFIQQLAVSYVTKGYLFYVSGTIPEGKDPAKTDAKILEQYGIPMSKFTRCRKRREGIASIQYLRHERFFIIIATHGEHRFFEKEGKSVKDLRRAPLQFAGHSIGCVEHRGKLRPSVRIARTTFLNLKRSFAEQARDPLPQLETEFRRLPFEPYAPVRNQLSTLFRLVNRTRKTASMQQIDASALRLRRLPVKPFG